MDIPMTDDDGLSAPGTPPPDAPPPERRKKRKKGQIKANRAKGQRRLVMTKDGLRMVSTEESSPLVNGDDGRGPYMGVTLVPERPPDRRTMFNKKLGARIEHRKQLLQRRHWLVNLMFGVALVGIVLMVIENELYFVNNKEKDSTVSLMLKMFMSISTGMLLVTILLYYHTGAEIRMLDAKVDDPLAVTSFSTWISLVTELTVCSVHPFPGDVMVTMSNIAGMVDKYHMDGILSVLMMFRLYLVGRFLVVHSPLLTDSSTQTISAVSHVKISMFFVFKAAMNANPGSVIIVTMMSMYVISVWSMRTCEMYYTSIDEAQSFSESMWLSAITFLTVGYGDLTPTTHCGRFIAILTGLMGLATTALLVSVVSRKLEQTRGEKSVFNYLSLIHLEHRKKAIAANVIKIAVRVYILKRRISRSNTQYNQVALTYHSWRLSNAIRLMRSTRVERQGLEETSVGLTELSQQVSQTQALINKLTASQGQILDKLTDLQDRLRDRDDRQYDYYSTDDGGARSERGSRYQLDSFDIA